MVCKPAPRKPRAPTPALSDSSMDTLRAVDVPAAPTPVKAPAPSLAVTSAPTKRAVKRLRFEDKEDFKSKLQHVVSTLDHYANVVLPKRAEQLHQMAKEAEDRNAKYLELLGVCKELRERMDA